MVKALILLHYSSLNGNILWNMLFNFDKVHTKLKKRSMNSNLHVYSTSSKNCVRQVNIITFSDTKWMCIIKACIRGYFHKKNPTVKRLFSYYGRRSLRNASVVSRTVITQTAADWHLSKLVIRILLM